MMDRKLLDAFVDGALSPEDSARVVMHLADFPRDSAYVDAVMEANELVAAAYAAPLYEPLPERFRAAIFAGSACAPRASRPSARTLPWRRRGAVRAFAAAAVSAGVALAVGLTVAPLWRAGTVETAGGPGADAQLLAALENERMGTIGGAQGLEITLVGTFFDSDQRPCREYQVLDTAGGVRTEGLACREAGARWTTEVAVASRLTTPAATRQSFVPAEGGDGDTALADALDRLGAGMALTANEEEMLIAGDWAR